MVKFSAMIEDDDAAFLEAEARRLDRPQAYILREALHRHRMVQKTGVAFDSDRVPASEAA